MPTFGSFETDREVYSGPAYTVYSANKVGDPKTEYAVKIFSIRRLDIDEESAATLDSLIGDLETACVERIAVQQKAATTSKFVTPIIETGRDERGVWYATRFYSRSVNRIISGRVALSRDAFEHIFRSMAQGALDIKRACGRSHGDILPSNVQISRSEKLSEAEVVLSDPLPGNASDASRYELSDLRAIGRIMLQVVLQREMHQEEDFLILPILLTPEWTRMFGKSANQWLALCNRLLDPNLSPQQFSLEQLAAEMDNLRPKPPVSKTTGILVAVGVVLLGMAGIFVAMYFKNGNLSITVDPPGSEVTLRNQKESHSYKAPFEKGKPLVIKRLPKGDYVAVVKYGNLAEQTNAVAIEGGKTREYNFALTFGAVEIISDPSNADVEQNGKKVGTTPFNNPVLSPGLVSYTLLLTNHEPRKVTLMVPSDRSVASVRTNLVQMKGDDGYVEIKSQPENATITLDSTPLSDKTPFFKTLSAGSHKITAQFQDWPSLSTQIVVVPGPNPALEFAFPHRRTRFDVTPADAEVSLNGKTVRGNVYLPLRYGDYTVIITSPGYKSYTNRITITEGKAYMISVDLEAMLGAVTFSTDPVGATIYDVKSPNKPLGNTSGGTFKTNFPPGSYTFFADYEGLDRVQSKSVQVAMGSSITLPLTFNYGSLQVETEPPGADVVIAGRKKPSPIYYIQKPGSVTYHVELTYYESEDGTRDLLAGKPVKLSLALRRKQVAFTVKSDPPGAMLSTPAGALKGANDSYTSPWGPVSITARYPTLPGLPELDPKSESVDVDKDGKTSKQFSFSYGMLNLTNEDSDARLLYKDKAITNFPARLYLKPAAYDFTVEYGGDFRTNLHVEIAERQTTTPQVLLPELRKVYTNSINMIMVRVTKDLYAGKFEVTEEQYRAIMGGAMQGKNLQPVVDVKWQEAIKFCETLTGAAKEKETSTKQKLAGWKYSPPTEAEWKLFAEPVAAVLDGSLFSRSGLQIPAEIDFARKSATSLGIYDVFGNAAEWAYGTGNQPMTLGGSVANAKPKPEDALARLRSTTVPPDAIANGSPTIGFRCVLKRQ